MSQRMKSLKVLAVAVGFVGMLGFYTEVRADLTPIFSSVTPNGANFDFTYHVDLGLNQFVQIGAVPGASTPTAVGQSGATFADYFTIYDFSGFTGVHSEPAGWAFQSLLLGSTPSTTVPADDPNIPNLTWYWVGPPPSCFTDACLNLVGLAGVFVAQSSIGSALTIDNFTSDASKDAPGTLADGTATASIGTVSVPTAPPTGVPEPASLLLLGSGLAGLGLWGRKRLKN